MQKLRDHSFCLIVEVFFSSIDGLLTFPSDKQCFVFIKKCIFFFSPFESVITRVSAIEMFQVSWNSVQFPHEGRKGCVVLFCQHIQNWCQFCHWKLFLRQSYSCCFSFWLHSNIWNIISKAPLIIWIYHYQSILIHIDSLIFIS